MNVFLAVLAAFPTILELIVTAERLYREAKAGAAKKETVMHGVSLALDASKLAGAKITDTQVQAVTTVLDQAVDKTVELFNRAGWPGEANRD